jgi:medium-chain acyl-[acyl-carrier-protein] hydrolase
MDSLIYEKEYRVHVYETGPDGRLGIHSLFNYLQDIASDHAVRLGFGKDDLARDNRFWVLSRMYAVINEWPSWGEKIIVRTWPNGTDKLFALRNYEVSNSDGRILASSTSSWLILDQTTKKIQRPDSILSQYNRNLRQNESPLRYASKLKSAEPAGELNLHGNIRVSDLDVNLHTNNVNYLKWVIDRYEIGFIMKYAPRSVEINYLAESVFGQEVVIRSSIETEDTNIINHSLIRTYDSKELCTIRIEWEESIVKQVN